MKRPCLIIFIAALLTPSTMLACACGCSVFSVGMRGTMPSAPGFSAYLHYNYMDQNRNWGSWNTASPDLNADQEIRTSFYTVGLQFMSNAEWGINVEAPVWDRYFRTIDDDGNTETTQHTSMGDIRVMGMYTGLTGDMSTGLQLGFKLPTGSFTLDGLDRDTQIGSGTTDVLLGAYKRFQENGWGWDAQVAWQHALNTRDGYRPGDSFDANLAVHYDNLVQDFHVIPVLQFVASFRAIDSGENSDPDNTGYQRIYLSPGIEVVVTNHLRFYTDIRIPLMTHVRGYQLVAPSLASLSVGYSF